MQSYRSASVHVGRTDHGFSPVRKKADSCCQFARFCCVVCACVGFVTLTPLSCGAIVSCLRILRARGTGRSQGSHPSAQMQRAVRKPRTLTTQALRVRPVSRTFPRDARYERGAPNNSFSGALHTPPKALISREKTKSVCTPTQNPPPPPPFRL